MHFFLCNGGRENSAEGGREGQGLSRMSCWLQETDLEKQWHLFASLFPCEFIQAGQILSVGISVVL